LYGAKYEEYSRLKSSVRSRYGTMVAKSFAGHALVHASYEAEACAVARATRSGGTLIFF
jgi:hypothetical protein